MPDRRLPFALALAALAATASAPAHARDSTATGVATATVIAPLSVVAVRELDFGTVAVALAQGGTVTVATAGGGATYGGSARQACLSGPNCAMPAPALFRASGEGGRDYLITIPASVAARPDGGAGAPLAVSGLTVRSASEPSAGPRGRLDATGHDSFEIGGRIDVPAGTEPARYRAVIEVVLTYG